MSAVHRKILMKNRKWLLAVFALCIFVCCNTNLFAQEISATIKADSTHIVIGDFLNVKLTVKAPKDIAVTIPVVTDTVGNMELVKTAKMDTVTNGNENIYTQTYTVSAYDSGSYHAGPLKIFTKDKNGAIDTIVSDFVFVSVTTVAVDTTKPFKPIKAPIDVPYSWQEFIPYIIGGIVLLALIAALIYFFVFRKQKVTVTEERPKPKEPAEIWANSELRKLDDEKLWQQNQVKKFYSRLSEILRMYLEYRYSWFALESTTEEISDKIDSYKISEEAKESLLFILSNADLVKFAKMNPSADVNMKAMENGFRFVELTKPNELSTEA